VAVGVWTGVRVQLSVGYQDMGVWWAAGGLLPAGLFVYVGVSWAAGQAGLASMSGVTGCSGTGGANSNNPS
jgi:hypothetical protein